MSTLEKRQIAEAITIPEIKSCVAQLLDSMEEVEDTKSRRLTLLALLSFYRKNLHNDMSIETDKNILKSRLIESGVLYFGANFNPQVSLPRAKYLMLLEEAGFCREHLAFLNPTQVELFFTYVRETGLVSNA